MDVRHAFLKTSRTIFHAMQELGSYIVVGNSASINILKVNYFEKEKYENSKNPIISDIKKIPAEVFYSFTSLFNESSIVLSYSWLETYLSEMEEILFLHDPSSIGESVQIKLGKVISCKDINELVHDVAKRKVRDKSQWGIKNRISEIKEKYGVNISVSEKQLEWVSDFRNNVVHNRRPGSFKTNSKKAEYVNHPNKGAISRDDVNEFIHIVFKLMSELYQGISKTLGISMKYKSHKYNIEYVKFMEKTWRSSRN